MLLLLVFTGLNSLQAQITSAGTGWGELNPAETLLVNENFQDFEFFHSDENPDQGNSDHAIDENSGEIVRNYKTIEKSLVAEGAEIKFHFTECAFAPEWSTAYAYKNQTENTDGVSNGFVETSRFDTIYSQIHTDRGYVLVDLSELESVEIIQYSHSSTGGSKRGIMVEFSTDKGATWDTLRYQPGSNYSASFTKDPFTREKTSNAFNCDPSAYGMLWEDAIYWYDGNFMLRFRECGGQTVRLHDLKIYGTAGTSASALYVNRSLQIKLIEQSIVLDKAVENIDVYMITGKKMLSGINTTTLDVHALKPGVYLVRAMNAGKVFSEKIVIK